MTAGRESVRRESHPPIHRGRVVPGLLGHGHGKASPRGSKDGRIRTLCVRVGAALLSQEHVLVGQSQRRRQESNLLEVGLQPTAWPSGPGVIVSLSRASGGSRTHSLRLTRAAPVLSGLAGMGWPVGVEPTQSRFTAGSRYHFGFGHSVPGRSRTCMASAFAGRRASTTPQGQSSTPSVPRPGVEPGPAPSEGAMMSVSPPGQSACRAGVEPAQQARAGYSRLGSPVPSRHVQYPGWDLNPRSSP